MISSAIFRHRGPLAADRVRLCRGNAEAFGVRQGFVDPVDAGDVCVDVVDGLGAFAGGVMDAVTATGLLGSHLLPSDIGLHQQAGGTVLQDETV